jgi:hypothetical protein
MNPPNQTSALLQATKINGLHEYQTSTESACVELSREAKPLNTKDCRGVELRKGDNERNGYHTDALCQGCDGTCHAPLTAWTRPDFTVIRNSLNGHGWGYV